MKSKMGKKARHRGCAKNQGGGLTGQADEPSCAFSITEKEDGNVSVWNSKQIGKSGRARGAKNLAFPERERRSGLETCPNLPL